MQSNHILKAEFPCVCGNKLEVVTPSRSIMNSPNVSMISFPHEKPVVCGKCNRNFAPAIAEFEVIWGWQEIEAPKEVLVIDSPNVIKEVSKFKN
jgi:hypothetical protein